MSDGFIMYEPIDLIELVGGSRDGMILDVKKTDNEVRRRTASGSVEVYCRVSSTIFEYEGILDWDA